MTAPDFRSVEALTGQRRPSGFFDSLSEADRQVAELEALREWKARVCEAMGIDPQTSVEAAVFCAREGALALDELHELRTRVQELEVKA